MPNLDNYSVYTSDGKLIMSGTFCEIEDYIDKAGYTVVWDYTGYIVSGN